MSMDLERIQKELLKCLLTDLKALVVEIETFMPDGYHPNTEDSSRKSLTAILSRIDVARFALRYLRPLLDILSDSDILGDSETIDLLENANTLNIEGLNQSQILQAVAAKRLQAYPTQREAAASLGIDTRTLKKYAAYKAPEKSVLRAEEDS